MIGSDMLNIEAPRPNLPIVLDCELRERNASRRTSANRPPLPPKLTKIALNSLV